jgi:hypothetical protein
MRKYADAERMTRLRRRLAVYAEVWPDSDFLDSLHARASAGSTFTESTIRAAEDALLKWEMRVNGPRPDPDRCPRGFDQLTWQLATCYRDAMDARGLPCPSRQAVYHEISRVIRRDRFREDYQPWRDEPGKPGWYRMMTDIIRCHVSEVSEDRAWYAHEDLAQPGTATGIRGWLTEQALLAVFSRVATPQSPPPPSPERLAQVKAIKQHIREERQ